MKNIAIPFDVESIMKKESPEMLHNVLFTYFVVGLKGVGCVADLSKMRYPAE